MLDYLSDYRTQDEMHGVHYYPSGALCWFETNQYGDPTGNVFYIKKVPDMELLKIPRRQRGYKKFVNQQQMKPTIKELLTREKPDTEVWEFQKPRFINKRKE